MAVIVEKVDGKELRRESSARVLGAMSSQGYCPTIDEGVWLRVRCNMVELTIELVQIGSNYHQLKQFLEIHTY